MNKVLFCIVFSLAFLDISSIVFAIDNPGYVDLQNYAKELGYQIGTEYKELVNDDVIITRRQLTPSKQFIISSSEQTPEQVFIISLKEVNNSENIYFLAKITKEGENLFLTFFDKEGGIKIDLTNESIADVWAIHHSCDKWSCAKYYILGGYVLNDLTLWFTCAGQITACVASIPFGGEGCVLLVDCVLKATGSNLIKCFTNACYYYPCQQDCSENNYNSSFVFYCDINNRMKHNYQYVYKCPSNIGYGKEGTCILDNQKSGWINNQLVEVCPNYCADGICTSNSITTTTTILTTTTISSDTWKSDIERRMTEIETRTSLLEIIFSNVISKICSIRYFDDLCKPKCPRPYSCSNTCVDDTTKPTCYDRTSHTEYYCSSNRICCESARMNCPT